MKLPDKNHRHYTSKCKYVNPISVTAVQDLAEASKEAAVAARDRI